MQNPFVANALSNVHEIPNDFRRLDGSSKDPGSLDWRVNIDEKTGSVVTDTRLRLKLIADTKEDTKSEAILNDVFVLGDCAIMEDTHYPATAQVAAQKASWLAKRLNRNDIDTSSGFTWKNMGTMAYIGNWNALLQGGGNAGGISGRLAWIIWRGAYLTKSVSWRNKILIPVYW